MVDDGDSARNLEREFGEGICEGEYLGKLGKDFSLNIWRKEKDNIS